MANEMNKTFAEQVPGEERLKLAAVAMAENKKLHENGQAEKETNKIINADTVKEIINDWPATAKMAAENTMKFYGPPNEATQSYLVWHNNGPWKRTIAFKDGVPHDFPEPHTDVLEQFIDYHVPADKVGLVAQLEGSLVIDRTKGEVSVHCDNEGANTLSMNMMHEVVTGQRTPQEAREFIKKEIVEYMMNRPAPYAEKFQFQLLQGEHWDPDVTVVEDQELMKAVTQKQKELGLH
ncbi:hypothetical protein D1B33_16455 [Lysinibacillus yapensis]|uniref:Uncharacterized protein n=1 Tax=Ureibacillus yapensis TaxID=2304605 RepID=A0A396S711_9BACL|nr:hypothetical protein [Lysinibacillus yapensis]RHW32758.1 hypothetical protein D1B33_16455 [Lysinibacillus yapensis]